MSAGGRIAEHMSIGVLARTYPRERIQKILVRMWLQGKRIRDLPADALVYYVLALGLFMAVSTGEVLRSLVEGLHWLGGASNKVKTAGKAAISRARSRLGPAPLRALWEESAKPISIHGQPGEFYRIWRLVSIDGSTLDIPDTEENLAHFGRQESSRGQSAFPQLRVVALCENGSHGICAVRTGPYRTHETALADALVGKLLSEMLCLADRGFTNFQIWRKASATGADLVWRVPSNADLAVEKVLEYGSYLPRIYPSEKAKRKKRNRIVVRVIEYRLVDVEEAEPLYRLLTTILDPEQAPAVELASRYCERWEVEVVLDEFKTHMRGGQIVLRSKTPELVTQEFYGMMLAHSDVHSLMNEVALRQNLDPERLSFTHAIWVIRRKLAAMPALSP